MEKQSFQSWKGKFILSFLICERKVNISSVGALTPKQVSWWKASIPAKCPALSYHADGLRVFVDVIEYPFEDKLTQLKSHQQLYVPLLRNSLQSLYKSAKMALSHLSSSSSQRHGVMRRSWRSGLKRTEITFSTIHQLLNPPSELFMQTCIEPSKHPILSTGS